MTIRFRIITLSGVPCSGVTTLADLLSTKIGWQYQNPGSELSRKYLADHRLPLSAINQIPDDDEREHDKKAQQIITNDHHKIVGGRLSGWLAHDIPDVFKIFVTAEKDVRIARYVKRESMSKTQASEEIKKREDAEALKYRRLYHVDARDPKWYDLVVDTSHTTPDETLRTVLSRLQKS